MAIDIRLMDGSGSRRKARVSEFGQLVTAPLAYNLSASATMSEADTPVNLVSPNAGSRVVISTIALTTNSFLGIAGAGITVYGSSVGPTSAVQTQVVTSVHLARDSSLAIPQVNVLLDKGLWVNAVTDDDDAFITIFYHRVPLNEN